MQHNNISDTSYNDFIIKYFPYFMVLTSFFDLSEIVFNLIWFIILLIIRKYNNDKLLYLLLIIVVIIGLTLNTSLFSILASIIISIMYHMLIKYPNKFRIAN